MAVPPPPKMGKAALIPGIILLLIGAGGPVLELWDRAQDPVDVRAATVTATHREPATRVGKSDSSSPGSHREVRTCDIELPDGSTDSVVCTTEGAGKDVGDELEVYQDDGTWKVYSSDLFWLLRGALFTLAGLAYVAFWIWARRFHRRARR